MNEWLQGFRHKFSGMSMQEAEMVAQVSASSSEDELGKNHPTTLEAKTHYGFILQQLRKLGEAKRVYSQVISASNRAPENDEIIRIAQQHLASIAQHPGIH